MMWSVDTSVEARYFAEVGGGDHGPIFLFDMVQPILPSPDGRRFLTLTTNGNLRTDHNDMELRVYDTDAVLNAVRSNRAMPAPIAMLSRSSASSVPALGLPRWSANGKQILLVTVSDQDRRSAPALNWQEMPDAGLAAIARFDVETGKLVELVPAGNLSDYRVPGTINAWSDDIVLFNRPTIVATRSTPKPDAYPFAVVTRENLFGLGGDKQERVLGKSEYLVASSREISPIEGLGDGSIAAFALSPDGRQAIVATTDASRASALAGYTYRPGDIGRSRFLLLDVTTRRARTLIDLPLGMALQNGGQMNSNALWFPDGKQVILLNTALPLDTATSARADTGYIAALNLETGTVEPIMPVTVNGMSVKDAIWAVPGEVLEVSLWDDGNARPVSSRIFLYRMRSWAIGPKPPTVPGRIAWDVPRFKGSSFDHNRRPPPLRASNGLSVELREGPDQPQRLMVSNGKRERVLIDADPKLKGVKIARSEVVTWKTADGREERGLLTLPFQVKPGMKVPLVIQGYSFMPFQFRPDGPAPSGYAAQALAARGIAVLGVDIALMAKQRGVAGIEGHLVKTTFEAAVDVLVKRGLIDPDRLGMVGFSHGGFEPYYVLTHPGKYKLAAAMSWDAARFAYSDYLAAGILEYPEGGPASYGRAYTEQTVTGKAQGGSFWADKESWLRESGEFNVDKATGPYMFIGNGLGLDYYDQYRSLMASFSITRRPLELANFPLASHPMARPRERQAAMGLTVEWFDFWLNGRDSPDPAKREQYDRWQKMLTDWRRQQAWEKAGHPVGSGPTAEFRADALAPAGS